LRQCPLFATFLKVVWLAVVVDKVIASNIALQQTSAYYCGIIICAYILQYAYNRKNNFTENVCF